MVAEQMRRIGFVPRQTMGRHPVVRTDRISVTEAMLSAVTARSVLEVGAGDHSFAPAIRTPDTTWMTVDAAPPADFLCDLNVENVSLPFPDARFDLVVCTELLEHMLWPHLLLSEIRRVLLPSGRLVASVPNAASLTYRLSWVLGRVPSCAASGNMPAALGGNAYQWIDGSLTGGHVIDFTFKRFAALLGFSGFEPMEWKGSGLIWHWQIAPKWAIPPSFASNIIVSARPVG